MPTGSLCAERNVIGSALAADLSLLRRDIKAVAVLGMSCLGRNSKIAGAALPPGGTDSSRGSGPGVGPCGIRLSVGAPMSSVTSSYGSSIPSPSCAVSSPLDTPTLRVSPACGGHGGGNGAGRRSGGVGLDGIAGKGAVGITGSGDSGVGDRVSNDREEEEERLEGVREVSQVQWIVFMAHPLCAVMIYVREQPIPVSDTRAHSWLIASLISRCC